MNTWRSAPSGGGSNAEVSRGDYKVEAAIASKMDELKRYQRGATKERSVAIGVRTGEILYDAVGDPMAVDVSKGFENDKKPLGDAGKRRFAAAAPLSLLDIHTHVGDSSMSERDWGAFMFPQIIETRLITDDAVYVARKTDAFSRLPEMVATPEAVRALYNHIFAKKMAALGVENEKTLRAATIGTSLAVAEQRGVSFVALGR